MEGHTIFFQAEKLSVTENNRMFFQRDQKGFKKLFQHSIFDLLVSEQYAIEV